MNIEKDAMSVTPSVSVVIAVYKVEEYIAQCCHSLFAQTLKNIEYIFVDDCSPDKSMDIVQLVLAEYPDRRGQVKIIRHPQNMGVSRTREDGVKAATGEYIIHCDPDDWVELDMYEQLYNKAVEENADMVLCDLWWHYPEDPKPYYDCEKPKELTSRSILASCLSAQYPILHSFLHNKLIRSRLYKMVEWPHEISFCEDMVVCTQILSLPISVYHVKRPYYHYRFLRTGSLSNRDYRQEDAEKDLKAIRILHKYLIRADDAELVSFWQSCVANFMIGTLNADRRVFTNKVYLEKYRQYRDCIWKNRCLSPIKKMMLYCATYNYFVAFNLYKFLKYSRSALIKRNSGA